MDFGSLTQTFQFRKPESSLCVCRVLEEPTDVMGSAVCHSEIQKIGTAAPKSIEKPGILGGLFSLCNVYLVLWISATSPFICLAGIGKFGGLVSILGTVL